MTVRILLFAIIFLLGGCASLGNFNSVYRKLDTSTGKGVLIDIKQRAILVGEVDGQRIVCAEPSPDALSAYAAEIAAKVDRPEVAAVQLSGAIQEGASFVGLRTSTIQLLRDSMYRLCEAHLNGAIDGPAYNFQLRKYQRQLVSLLAIEQITGIQRSPTVAIDTRGSAQIARDLKALQNESDALKGQIDAIDNKLKDAKDNKDALTDERNGLVARKKDVDSAIANDRELLASGSTTTQIGQTPHDTPSNDRSDLYSTVLDIVERATDRNDFETQCVIYLMETEKKNLDNQRRRDPIYDTCDKLTRSYQDRILKNEQYERVISELRASLDAANHELAKHSKDESRSFSVDGTSLRAATQSIQRAYDSLKGLKRVNEDAQPSPEP